MGVNSQPRGEDNGQLIRLEVTGYMPSTMKGIHCHLIHHPPQGTSCGDNRMEQCAAGTFSLVQSRLQAESERSGSRRKEEGGYAAEIGREIRSGEERLCGINKYLVEERLCGILNIVAVWDSLQAITSPQIASEPPLSFSFLAAVKRIHMAPRLRATPRRGCHHGQRGGVGGRGRHSPRRISPLACASPPSNKSEGSEQSICNIVQSARFHYRRRTNKPFISTLVTVIFSEEDEEEDSMKDPSAEQSPSHSNSSSLSRWIEDSFYAPSSQSKIEEESTFAHTEEQAEVIQEIGSMQEKNSLDRAQEQAKNSHERVDTRQTSPQKQSMHKEPDIPFNTLLCPKLPPGMKLEDIPPGMEITWEPLDEDIGQGSANIK